MMAVLLDDQPLDSQHYRKLITYVVYFFLSCCQVAKIVHDCHMLFFEVGGGAGCITVEQNIPYDS